MGERDGRKPKENAEMWTRKHPRKIILTWGGQPIKDLGCLRGVGEGPSLAKNGYAERGRGKHKVGGATMLIKKVMIEGDSYKIEDIQGP